MRCRRNPAPLFFIICSPYVDGNDYHAYLVDPDGDVDYVVVRWDSCGRNSPDFNDFYIALYVLPDGDISSDYSRNINDSYGKYI